MCRSLLHRITGVVQVDSTLREALLHAQMHRQVQLILIIIFSICGQNNFVMYRVGYYVPMSGSPYYWSCPSGQYSTGGASACTNAPAGVASIVYGFNIQFLLLFYLWQCYLASSHFRAVDLCFVRAGSVITSSGQSNYAACLAGTYSTGGASVCSNAPGGL